jgi:hypothetical protein
MTQYTLDLEPAPLNRPAVLAAIARQMGERGACLARDKAERADPAFSERAKAFVLSYLKANGVSSGELITDAAKLAGIKPPDDRAFGAVYGSLSRKGQIVCAGYCARVKGHGTAGGRLWRLAA